MPDRDASLPLQKAIVTALTTASAIAALVGDRIFDEVPENAAKPYISLGPEQALPEYADCYEGSRYRIQVDAWSEEPGRVEVKRIGSAIRTVLQQLPSPLEDGSRLVHRAIEQTRYLREPDGRTYHAVVILIAHTEPSA